MLESINNSDVALKCLHDVGCTETIQILHHFVRMRFGIFERKKATTTTSKKKQKMFNDIFDISILMFSSEFT